MAKKNEIIVRDVNIRTMTVNGVDYICITDKARQKNVDEANDVVKNWMRQKNTLEYLGFWEKLHNPSFKGVEFAPLLSEAVLINDGLPQGERLVKLNQIAIQQMRVLTDDEGRKLLK